ncbi:hypothetical protein STIAU_2891, partial [Stigmatella aurantiaca DW4/3-1]
MTEKPRALPNVIWAPLAGQD